MKRRVIYGALAAVIGVGVGVGAVFLGGSLAAENHPSTDVNSVDANSGFVQGAVEYGTRGSDDENR